MLIFHGSDALSGFRIEKILSQIHAVAPEVTAIRTHHVHFASVSATLDANETTCLEKLLDYGKSSQEKNESGPRLLVTPRPGTVSPWSSKATDIARNCGLEKVLRLERGTEWSFTASSGIDLISFREKIKPFIHDRMTETVWTSIEEAGVLFNQAEPRPLQIIDILQTKRPALEKANREMGLALSDAELEYLLENFLDLERNPTDVELMMFAQANSEHCRHKIFNAEWTIAGEKKTNSLFDMIRSTHDASPGRVLSAYSDNAAVMKGYPATRFYPAKGDHRYLTREEDVHILMKVETHNHPTAISPYPGASTGSGGEIRDESATGRGARPRAGLTGYTVSNLRIPGFIQDWEEDNGKPDRIASALEIMLEAPIGGAAFNNEFGRPALCGYFRTFEQTEQPGRIRGYHKPIMLAGGYGMIRNDHVHKHTIPAGSALIVLGGPAMLIGLGGGAASSMASGSSDAVLDFASVQRDNPEMQRRCQEVINACWALGSTNPIISIHDVGAGGLSNALPELVSASKRGARFELRDIPSAEPGLSPMEIWCNEAQERYVLAIAPESVTLFTELCQRERAPFAVIGEASDDDQLVLHDALFENDPVNMPLPVLLGKLPRTQCHADPGRRSFEPLPADRIDLADTIQRVLRLPAVADKRFLITIGDRSITGLTVRDQMVGPWQTPVADCAVTSSGYGAVVGETMAIGERTPLALVDAPASGRMAVTEAITNICAARILSLADVCLSANWMAACGEDNEDAELYATVEAVSEFCRSLGICIPVGKDSLSMRTHWQDEAQTKQVVSPLSLIVSAFAPVADTRQNLTPQLGIDAGETVLMLIDLGRGKNRCGGTALSQVHNHIGGETPDLDAPDLLKQFFQAVQILNETGLLLAYHDRSDGGLFVTLCEMAFAAHNGIDVSLDDLAGEPLSVLFNEEAGAVIQVRREDIEAVNKVFSNTGELSKHVHVVGTLNTDKRFRITRNGREIWSDDLAGLHRLWSETTFHMQALRDNPECAREEYDSVVNMDDPGLTIMATFAGEPPVIKTPARPRIAILREQGVNGQVEMAAAFDRAGFESVDVHMNDLMQGNVALDTFTGLVACGGFSYGDVLGAGGGWANTVLFNDKLRDAFRVFFHRNDTFGLGVCNGCQMFSHLRELIPGAGHWPDFVSNRSEQFESRLVMVEVLESPSILLQGMNGSRLPIAVAHGEGRVLFPGVTAKNNALPVLRYIDNYGKPTETYPANPNGSPAGVTGFTSDDGRFTIMMPHPERMFLRQQYSWLPAEWHDEEGPWMRLFHNARAWLD